MKKIAFCLILLCSLSAYSQNNDIKKENMIVWSSDCAVCDKLLVDGTQYFTFEKSNILLAVTMNPFKDYFVADIYLQNLTEKKFDFYPTNTYMEYWEKEKDFQSRQVPTRIFPLPPEEIAKKLERKAKIASALATFGSSMSKSTITSRTSDGTTVTTTTPDYNAQRNTQNENNQRESAAKNIGKSIIADSLKANTMFPNDKLSGTLFFKKHKFYLAGLCVNVDEYLFCVPYSN